MQTPLKNRTYRNLFIAQVIALAGTGFTTVALALLAYDLAGGQAGAVLGTALALKMVAYVGIAPAVGAFAHHLPRKKMLIGLDLTRAGLVACLPFVTEIWQIYALIFLLNACSAGFTPTFQATIPDVLPEESQYTRALSLSRLAYDLENLLVPGLAAIALMFVSFHVLFAVNAVAFLVSAALVMSVMLPKPRPSERAGGVRENLSFGVRAYLATPRLRGLLALSLAVSAAGSMVIVNTVVYVRDFLGGSQSDMAFVLAAAGAGSMVVALMLPRLLDRMPDRPFMLGGGLLLTAGLLCGLTKPGLIMLLPVWFVLGAGSSLIQTPAGRLLQRSCHGSDRPALFAAQFALSHACWLITYPLAGHLSAHMGLSVTFAVLALVVLSATIAGMALWPSSDTTELEHAHEEIEHKHLHIHDDGHHHQHSHEGHEGEEPHSHPHKHEATKHKHAFVIDLHHREWPA
jgi:MFS family permease